jgi:hypothetical protein
MHLYILTRGRADIQLTLAQLPNAAAAVSLVVPRVEAAAYRLANPDVDVLVQPDSVRLISEKRAWTCRQHFQNGRREPLLLLDDDLHFYLWTQGHHRTTLSASGAEWRAFWRTTLPRLFAQFTAVSLGTKAFALPGGVRPNYHMGFAFGFTYEAYKAIKWNRVNFYEDIDYTLQLLRRGCNIGVTYDCVVQQHKAQAAGGCDGERTVEAMQRDLKKLIVLHPGIIQEKVATSSHPQANTRISWRRAAKEGGLA